MTFKATMCGCPCTVISRGHWWGIEGTQGLSKKPDWYILSDGVDVSRIPQEDYLTCDTPVTSQDQIADLVRYIK
jgi:hypothetical protein